MYIYTKEEGEGGLILQTPGNVYRMEDRAGGGWVGGGGYVMESNLCT